MEIFERMDRIGGRNSLLKIGDFKFELGPTFVMLPQVFEEVFSLAGKKLKDYVEMRKLDILYRLRFPDGRDLHVYSSEEKNIEEITKMFPGEEAGYREWRRKHAVKFERTYVCLKLPYNRLYHYFRYKLLRASLIMQNHKSVYGVLRDYFKSEELRMAMTFQAKYLGMSPWRCPGAFSILSYAEHAYGIYHPVGGVHKISEAMAKIAGEFGAKIHLNSPIKRILSEGGRARGVVLQDGRTIEADAVIMNADFAHGMKTLVEEKDRPSYRDAKLEKMKYSCSTFMLYFGMKKKYDIPHHNIFFGKNYRQNVDEIFSNKGMPENPAFYVQNASTTDDSLAPKGKSAIYVLVPVSNLESEFDWKGKKAELRNMIVAEIEKRAEMKDFSQNIEVERVISPDDWRDNYGVFRGAVFNLSHGLDQMLYLRPHNDFNDIKNLYLVGGGTHPGSGLPTILESGRIAAEMIIKKFI